VRQSIPEISVAIPARNAADTIAEQLRAVLSQQGAGALEVVVADNGSTDATAATVRSMAQLDPRLRLIDASHDRGEPGTRNAAVAACRAPVVASCDADDVVRPGWLAEIRKAFANDAHAVHVVRENWSLNAGFEQAGAPRYSMNSWLAGGAFAIERELFLELGGFDPALRVGADTEFGFRLLDHAGRHPYRATAAVVSVRLPHNSLSTFNRARSLALTWPELRRRHPSHMRPTATEAWSVRAQWSLWLLRHLPSLAGPRRLQWAEVCGTIAGEAEGSIIDALPGTLRAP